MPCSVASLSCSSCRQGGEGGGGMQVVNEAGQEWCGLRLCTCVSVVKERKEFGRGKVLRVACNSVPRALPTDVSTDPAGSHAFVFPPCLAVRQTTPHLLLQRTAPSGLSVSVTPPLFLPPAVEEHPSLLLGCRDACVFGLENGISLRDRRSSTF